LRPDPRPDDCRPARRHRARRLRSPIVTEASAQIDGDLDLLGVPARRRQRAKELLLDERLGTHPTVVAWLARPAGSRPIMSHLRELGLFAALRTLVVTLVAQYALGLFAWVCLAWGALSGRVDPGWLVAWAWRSAARRRCAACCWRRDRQRRPARRRGGQAPAPAWCLARRSRQHARARMGGIIGRTVESEAFESLALNGGMRLVIGTWELIVALVIASQGAGGAGLVLLGLAALGLASAVGVRYVRAKDAWTRARLAITGDLIERMVGHRTRLAQEAPTSWHQGEDAALADYVERSALPDALECGLAVWPRRVFMALGLVVIALASGSDPDPLAVALGLAGLLLGSQALDSAANGVAALAGAIVARRVVRDLIDAARRPERIGALLPAVTARTPDTGSPRPLVLELSNVGFSYSGPAAPGVSDIDLACAKAIACSWRAARAAASRRSRRSWRVCACHRAASCC